MQKTLCSVFLMTVCVAAWSQTPPVMRAAVSRAAATAAAHDASAAVRKVFPAAARQAVPLNNARIEALARRGKEKMVIQRALAVAVRKGAPAAFILQNGEVNRALLKRAWTDASGVMARWDGQSTLGMNAWLMVLASRLKRTLSADKTVLKRLETELETAQAEAEEIYRTQNAFSMRALPAREMEARPEYRALLAESVAQRLSDNFLPLLNSVDRMRFLKVLMQGVFEYPVRPVEINLAVLEKDVKAGLKFLGPRLKEVDGYGLMKARLNECAARAAEEAAANNITSVPVMRELMVEQMERFLEYWGNHASRKEDWKRLIKFYKEGATGPAYPEELFLK